MKILKAKNVTVKLCFRTKKYTVSRIRIERFIQSVFAYLKISDADISFCFVTNNYIRKLNERYKKRKCFTDVLAFPLHETICDADDKSKRLLGEVIISLDQTKINARRFKKSFEDELYLYIIHGILHVLGYEDTSKPKKTIMFALQTKIFDHITTT